MPTPIRVRGRRKRPWSPQDGTSKPIPSGSRGGRPMLSLEDKKASTQSSQSNKRARLLIASVSAPRPRKKKLSVLETLPVELIEKIFLYALNMDFPRASRSLAAAVSSERIYRALMLLAFWDDIPALGLSSTSASTPVSTLPSTSPAGSGVNAAIARLLRPLDDTYRLDQADRRALQTSIFRRRWCTIDRILDVLPELMHLDIQRHWFGAGIIMSPDEEDRLSVFLAQQQEPTAAPVTFEGTDSTNSNIYALSINPRISLTITSTDPESDPDSSAQTTHHPLSILSIPDHLLQGSTTEGFTQAHTHLLEILRISSGFKRPNLPATTTTASLFPHFSRESLQQGIQTALISNNHSALLTLLKTDEYVFRTQNTPLLTGNPPPPAPPLYTLPAEHFHTAIRMAKSDPSFFQSLLRASAESMPADDPEITHWAMEDLRYDPFGPWLLDFMLVLPQQRETARANPVDGSVFYLGRANAQIGIVGRYLREVLGVEELGGWMGESFLLDGGSA